MTEQRAREKKKLFATLLDMGITALHLDPRRQGVIVPGRFRQQNWLVLNYSYRYGIADFRFDDQVVEASLSFGGQPFYCRVPWAAVFAITDNSRQRGRIFHDEVPQDVDALVRSGNADPPIAHGQAPNPLATAAMPQSAVPNNVRTLARRKPAEAAAQKLARPGLQLIVGGKAESDSPEPAAADPADPSGEPPAAKPRGGHLRRVK